MRGLRSMSSGTAALFALAAPMLATVAAQTREPYPGLDAYIINAVQTWKVPGLSVAIVRHDSVIYAKGFGVLAVRGTTP